jgi:hypothetical protein
MLSDEETARFEAELGKRVRDAWVDATKRLRRTGGIADLLGNLPRVLMPALGLLDDLGRDPAGGAVLLRARWSSWLLD